VWQDHDLFNTCKQKTTKDAKHQQQTVGGRTFQFLVGLNKELDEIHGRIIGRAVSSSLGEIFVKVKRKNLTEM